MATDLIDSPDRYEEIAKLIHGKKLLHRFYENIYLRCVESLKKIKATGAVIELGAGASFLKNYVPDAQYTDVIAYPGLDRTLNATHMDLPDASVRAFFMMNVFHHIPDAEAFLNEARRTLKSGGALLILDQYKGWLSSFILKNVHHEPYVPDAKDWKFESSGPLSDANGALAWIVFQRDRARFEKLFPEFEIVAYEPWSPLRYWIAGGLKNWSMLPAIFDSLVEWIDRILVKIAPSMSSFVYIEIIRK